MSDELEVKPKIKHGVLTEVFDRNGGVIGIKFHPTPHMRLFVIERVKPENKSKSDDEVAKTCFNLTDSPVKKWAHRYGQHFIDWYEIELERSISPIKELLLAVGKEKALEGDFQYWQSLAKTYGVISPEVIEQRVSIGKLADNLDNLTEEQLMERQNKLLRIAQGIDKEDAIELVAIKKDL